jgi:predicted ester cyclase
MTELEAGKALVRRFDATSVIDDLVAEGDLLVARVTASATHVGELMGLPGTGRRCAIGEIHIFRIRDGKVVEHWHQFDQLGLMRQLGALPTG